MGAYNALLKTHSYPQNESSPSPSPSPSSTHTSPPTSPSHHLALPKDYNFAVMKTRSHDCNWQSPQQLMVVDSDYTTNLVKAHSQPHRRHHHSSVGEHDMMNASYPHQSPSDPMSDDSIQSPSRSSSQKKRKHNLVNDDDSTDSEDDKSMVITSPPPMSFSPPLFQPSQNMYSMQLPHIFSTPQIITTAPPQQSQHNQRSALPPPPQRRAPPPPGQASPQSVGVPTITPHQSMGSLQLNSDPQINMGKQRIFAPPPQRKAPPPPLEQQQLPQHLTGEIFVPKVFTPQTIIHPSHINPPKNDASEVTKRMRLDKLLN
eukprot:TRINITY_DN2372_c0_g1_i1.p1 TRINITY_DN2372_c0_g1~~TRINITY_DN2372_c0_g1_i1.p1  ORF type:complete len:316 (+),score=66.48 TRINITY_DN2372_c0_g1_i1:166-1113(+)